MVSSLIRTATFFMTAIASSNAAFVSQNAGSSTTFLRTSTVPRVSNLEPLHLFDTNVASDVVTTAANNMWLATIDSDIASIDDNQFGLVFAGGIVSNFLFGTWEDSNP